MTAGGKLRDEPEANHKSNKNNMKPTEKEICWMLTELREIIDECGIPTIRADKIGDYTTGIIVPAAYIADVREILEEGEHPATVEDHKVCGIVKSVY